MRYSNSFGKKSSKILLGTAYFGDTISEETSFMIMDKFYELGGRHIDTARLYADGESEKVISRWLKSRKPEEVFVSTKGAFPLKELLIYQDFLKKKYGKTLKKALKPLKQIR